MANNEQIDNTDYYRLPCGRYLEDYIYAKEMNFAEGSALKYMWRAGKKDGESNVKDTRKLLHYCNFLANRFCVNRDDVADEIGDYMDEASTWDGRDDSVNPIER